MSDAWKKSDLNPPRPCGRGLDYVFYKASEKLLKSAPPVWAGTGSGQASDHLDHHLNPPRPCGRGQARRRKHNRIPKLKSAPPVWAGTKAFRLADNKVST